MLTLYIACLVIGGTLVAVSIFGGGDADVDAAAAGGLDAAPDLDAGAGGGPDASGVDGEGLAAAARLLSFRNVVFFAAFFGLTGTLLTLLDVGSLLTPVFAVAAGTGAGALIHRVMTALGAGETGELEDAGRLEGAVARVLVGIDRKRSGKIAVDGGDRTFQVVARLHEQADARRFRPGDEVVIVRVVDAVAEVAGTQFLA